MHGYCAGTGWQLRRAHLCRCQCGRPLRILALVLITMFSAFKSLVPVCLGDESSLLTAALAKQVCALGMPL